MDEIDEGAIIDRVLSGDTDAFRVLVDAYGPLVYSLARRMIGDAEEARDVTQTVMLKAWHKLGTFDRGHRLFSWIYRIAINESLNQRGRRRRHDLLDERTRDVAPGPEQCLEQKEEERMVQEVLLKLGPKDREILVLRHFLRMSHREMAELLHAPEKTVKSRLHTARVRLEQRLRERGFGGA